MKKFVACALCAAMALAMAVAPAAKADEKLTREDLQALSEEGFVTEIECEPMEITWGCSGTLTGSIGGDAMEDGMAALERWTNGAMKIDFHQGGELGGDVELIQSVALGNVGVFQGAPTSQVTLIPELTVLDIGGLFKDVNNCNATLEAMKDKFEAAYEAKGLHLGDMWAADFRILSSNKPVQTADDLKGLNIRVQENEYHIAFWKELGCNPTPLAFGELYVALQQGMMDAQENPPISIFGPKLYEVQKYIVETNHIPFINTMVMNKAMYDSMSDNQKLAMDQLFEYLARYQKAGQAQNDAELLAFFQTEEGNSIEVTPVSEEISALFDGAADVVVELMKSKGIVPAELIDEYVAAARAQ